VSQAFKAMARSTGAHVAFAFLAMGGWAWLANSVHGPAAALGPALAQGALSGAITLGLKRVLEELAPRFEGWRALALPPALTASVILAVLIGVHALIGTPFIARTIALPWMVSTLYAIAYTAALVRERRA
jgi:hypothetical protein